MNANRLIPVLAVAGAIGYAAADAASAATPESQPANSANWAGYVANGTPGGTTPEFSSVSASWVEPSSDCSMAQGYASFWVGLGGAAQQAQALEQVGTEADCSSAGAAHHFAWYELVPAAPVRFDLPISSGDHVSGMVRVQGTNVTVSLADRTTGASATRTLSMSNPDVSSAEWIAEAPSACDGTGGCQPLPLTNFGTISFSSASATANGHTGTISDPDWTTQPVQLSSDGAGDDSAGAGLASDQPSVGAAPSELSADGSSFSVAWASSASQTAASGTPSAAGGGPGDADGGGSGYGGGGYGYGGVYGN